jgi:hypothetical protein
MGLLLACCSVFAFGQGGAGASRKMDYNDPIYYPSNIFNKKEMAAYLEVLFKTGPFTGSEEWKDRDAKRTINRYFKQSDYEKLVGNTSFGWSYPGKFLWKKEWNEVEFVPFVPAVPEAQFIRPQAWGDAMLLVAKRLGLTVRPGAPIKITGGVVGVYLGDIPSVVVEVKIVSPTGTLLFRGGFGKFKLSDAIGAAIEFVVNFGRGFDGVPYSAEQFKKELADLKAKSK